MKIIGVILSHNCGDLLNVAIQKCDLAVFDEIIVTDDGSTDGSLETVERLYPHLRIVHTTQKGYGANLKNGLKAAFDAGADFAVEVHGDGAQFHPKATFDAISLMKNGCDLIVGSRLINLKKSKELGYPFIRMYGNLILCFFYKILIDVPNSEFHVGYHVYSRNFYSKGLAGLADNYLMPVQVVCFAKHHDMKIAEVPVECSYLEEHTSHDLSGALWVSIKAFGTIFQYHLARFGFPTGYLK